MPPSLPTVRLGGQAVTACQPLPSISGFLLTRELRRGRMGVVYPAWQQALERTLALKMMRAGASACQEWVRRFDEEVRAVAHLRHPNIIQIYDVGTHEGLPYCTLEYLAGGSLAQRLDGKPMNPRR